MTFNNLGVALAMDLKFDTSVAKVLKLKVEKFVEVTREKLIRVTKAIKHGDILTKIVNIFQPLNILGKIIHHRCFAKL